MNNIKRIYFTAAALGACAISFGQNLNPTVEVTNTYEGDPSHIQKPLTEMMVPDSLLRFDLDFNYQVFDNPYDASYSFKPYMLNVKPGRDAWRGKSLYLKAGAGYSLHPQLDFVWSPERKGPFQFSIYANHRSYFGKYHEIVPKLKPGSPDVYELKSNGNSYKGHDALTRAGFDGRYSWDSGSFAFGLGYYGLNTKDTLTSQNYNAADVYLGLQSYDRPDAQFYYDAAVKGRFGKNNLKYSSGLGDLYGRSALNVLSGLGIAEGKCDYKETVISLDGNVGFAVNGHKFLVGLDGAYAGYSDLLRGAYGVFAVTPKYVFEKGKLKVNVGLRLQKFFSDNDEKDLLEPEEWDGGVMLNPDIYASIALVNGFQPYVRIYNGTKINTMSAVQEGRNHFFNPLCFSLGNDTGYDLSAGFKGDFSTAFHYDVNARLNSYDETLMDYVAYSGKEHYVPAYLRSECDVFSVNALMNLRVKRFKADADFHYYHTKFQEDGSHAFAMPDFTFGLKAVYDITSRIYCGANMSYVHNREGDFYVNSQGVYSIPAWFDLGISGGYQFSRKLGFWLESGNLLGQKVQPNPFYVEKGLWVTAGITLNL